MIYREYLTEYDEYSHHTKHSITISTDNFHVFKTIKAYAESVFENEDAPKPKMQAKAVIQNERISSKSEWTDCRHAKENNK